MKFTDENIAEAFDQAQQKLLNSDYCKGKDASELILDGYFINRMSDLVRAYDLLEDLTAYEDEPYWAKGVREFSEQEMVDFLFEVSYDDDVISVWISTDDNWETEATDRLERILRQMTKQQQSIPVIGVLLFFTNCKIYCVKPLTYSIYNGII